MMRHQMRACGFVRDIHDSQHTSASFIVLSDMSLIIDIFKFTFWVPSIPRQKSMSDALETLEIGGFEHTSEREMRNRSEIHGRCKSPHCLRLCNPAPLLFLPFGDILLDLVPSFSTHR